MPCNDTNFLCFFFICMHCSKHNRKSSLHSHSHKPHKLSEHHMPAEVPVPVPESLPVPPAPSLPAPEPHVEADPPAAPSLPPPKPHVRPDPEPKDEPHIEIIVPEEPYVTNNDQ